MEVFIYYGFFYYFFLAKQRRIEVTVGKARKSPTVYLYSVQTVDRALLREWTALVNITYKGIMKY